MTVSVGAGGAVYALVCEAGGIGSYITASNRLRHIAGASEVLEQIWTRVLDRVLQAHDGAGRTAIEFPRRAGGAFYASSQDETALRSFLALFSLAAAQHAPDLILQFGFGVGQTALQAHHDAINQSRGSRSIQPAAFPSAGPFVMRDARTGRAAVDRSKSFGRAVVDAPCYRFEKLLDDAVKRRVQPADDSFAAKFLPSDGVAQGYPWPTVFESDAESADDAQSFPWMATDEHVIGVIYADGSGMAVVAAKVRQFIAEKELCGNQNVFRDVFSQFSKAMDDATRNAAATATREVLIPNAGQHQLLPGRPILLGGDDVAIAVRADLALRYAHVFLASFERESASAINALKEQYPDLAKMDFPDCLTAGAGIVYARCSQPYARLHELAAQLCKSVKDAAKAVSQPATTPSVVGVYRLTTAVIDDVDAVRERDLSVIHHRYADLLSVKTEHIAPQRSADHVEHSGFATAELRLSLSSYALRRHDRLPSLDDLLALQTWLMTEPGRRSGLRKLTTLLSADPDQAIRHYQRWREQHRSDIAVFDGLLAALACGKAVHSSLPLWITPTTPNAEGTGVTVLRADSCLADVLALMAVSSTLPSNQKGPDAGA